MTNEERREAMLQLVREGIVALHKPHEPEPDPRQLGDREYALYLLFKQLPEKKQPND